MENRKAASRRLLANPDFSAQLVNKLVGAVTVLGVGALILGGATLYREFKPLPEKFFATNGMSRPVELRPLTDPVVTREGLLLWARDCAVATYDLDYAHWREQSRRAQSCFTNEAWNGFVAAYQRNLNTITDKNLTARPVPLAAPQIAVEGVFINRYAWKIQMPLRVTWENTNGRVPDDLLVEMTVVRSDDPEHPQRIALSQIIAKPYAPPPGYR